MIIIRDLLASLIAYPSVTPDDKGCQDYLQTILQELGFPCLRLNNPPVANLFARRGKTGPFLVFAGHTDVVPPGDRAAWHSDPFVLHENQGILYGRGTADMKGSIACMLLAVSRFISHYPDFNGSIGFLITSGEEGDEFMRGTPYVMEHLVKQQIKPDYCIVGEPSSTHHAGDTIKIGRRGSLTANITLTGIQGHVAYPHLADNPIHKIAPVIAELTSTVWDNGNDYFPPTTLQITSLHAGGEAGNIIPGQLSLQCNFRYSTEQTANSLQTKLEACFSKHQLTPAICWRLNGEPFLTRTGQLLSSCTEAIHEVTGKPPELSTSGGTSDGRFIAPHGVEVIELGPVNASIHQVNECVTLTDLETLSEIYYRICIKLLGCADNSH